MNRVLRREDRAGMVVRHSSVEGNETDIYLYE